MTEPEVPRPSRKAGWVLAGLVVVYLLFMVWVLSGRPALKARGWWLLLEGTRRAAGGVDAAGRWASDNYKRTVSPDG